MTPTLRDIANAFWMWRAFTHLHRAAICLERAGADKAVAPFDALVRELNVITERRRALYGRRDAA